MKTTPQDNKRTSEEQEERTSKGVFSSPATPSGSERLLPYLFAGMETCWIAAIFIGLAGGTHTFFLPLWAPFVFIAGSYWLSNALEQGRASATVGSPASFPSTLAVVVLLVGTALFSFWMGVYSASMAFFDPTWLGTLVNDLLLLSTEALHIVGILVLILFFCWRGLRLSHRVLEPGYILNTLRIGLGVILAVIVIGAVTHTASANEFLLLLLVPLFLLFTLTSHSLAQKMFMHSAHHTGEYDSTVSHERALLGIVMAFGAVLLMVSLFLGAVASPAFLANAQRIFEPVALVYNAIVNVIAFAMVLLITPIIWLLNLFHFKNQAQRVQTQTISAICKQRPHAPQCLKSVSPQTAFNPVLVLTIKILLPLLVIVLLVLIVRLLMRRRGISRASRIVEVHENLWSWALFWTQVRSLFRAFWLHFFPQQAEVTRVQEHEGDATHEPAARSIREVYRAMLRWASQRGYPRKRDETPYEFNARLRAALPSTEPQGSTLTEAYTAVRYGHVTPDEDEVARIQQTWQQLQRKMVNTQ